MGPGAQICLTFDLDGDESWRYDGPGATPNGNLSQRSWGRYGIVRGLPRILELLAGLDIRATFFVPGAVVDAYPSTIKELAASGHEIGHHGYQHFLPTRIDPAAQRDEIERGTEAIVNCVGATPLGYRAPGWRMTAETFELLCDGGFVYDSSMMGDDRPYLEEVDGKSILELPVHWSLDDFPHFGALAGDSGPLGDPTSVFDAWWSEVESAITERRCTSFCFHPEVIGHAWTFAPFERFVRRLHTAPRVSLERCIDAIKRFHGVGEECPTPGSRLGA